ncbi:MAG: leucine-rich repeat domain-containing protein [Lewinellaceae bacterium]|nr:leucine-rich repeat domain-containing protein [Lewinellaceae bacterium]
MNEKAMELISRCIATESKILSLGGCDLTEIPPEVKDMHWLKVLNLPKNREISDLRPLENLTNLQQLSVSNTRISDLGPLENLVNLQQLSVANTPVSNLEPLKNLSKLRILSVSNTMVSDLEPLKELRELRILSIFNTPVSDIGPLENLVNLQQLFIFNTQVFDLLPISTLIQKGIPITWSSSATPGENKVIALGAYSNSPITNPPREIVKQGNEAILRYFDEKERSGTLKVREAKLLIVGQGGAGKTTFRDKLLDANAELPPPDATTKGIEIRYLNGTMPGSGEPFRLNIWDFGGQNIQHYAHQFFLTGSALYALVTNEREQNANFQYWLNIIEMLGGASPVVIVQNKKEGHFEEIRNAAAIRERFGNVVNRFFAVDLKDAAKEQEFKELRKEILHRASQLPHVEREYLASFAAVREKVESAAAGKSVELVINSGVFISTEPSKHFLKWEEFLEIGTKVGIRNEELMKDYANAFTFLGVCQYFPDDVHLRNFVFLNPKWIIDALFQLLYHPKVEAQHGEFEEKDTFEIWKDKEYRGMEGHLLRMMENFELCYSIPGEARRYIVPQRLPAEQDSYNWDEPEATPLLYEYKFMPKGIVTRLTCRFHARIENDHVWNDAVIFTQPDGKARVFVREVYGEDKIELRAAGEKWAGLFNEVIFQIDDIHATSKFANLQVDKKVPCPCPECVSNPEKRHFYKYELLEKAIDKGKTKVECGNSTDDVRISDIFGKSGVKRPSRRRETVLGPDDAMEDTMRVQLEELIGMGDVSKALQLMQKHFPGNSEVLAQLSRLSLLEKDHGKGTVSAEDYRQERNLILNGVLNLMKQL